MPADKHMAAGVEVGYPDQPGPSLEFFGMGNVVARAENAAIADQKSALAEAGNGTSTMK